MKELFIIRHAKASEDYETIEDFDRPLKSRGVIQCYELSKKVKEKGVQPDLILCSPAARTMQTAALFAKTFGYPFEQIAFHSKMYEAYVEDLLTILESVDDKYERVFLVGHNPSMTNLANYLLDSHLNHVPPCGVVCVQLNVDSWKKLSQHKHQLGFFDYAIKRVIDKYIAEKQVKIEIEKPNNDAPKV